MQRNLIGQKLAEKGYRLTRQRQAVLEVLRGTRSHPDANWIYQEVCKIIPNVSLGTVYRTLGVLREAGLILELDYGHALSRYDGNTAPHYHVTCVKCGRMSDLDMPATADLERQAGDESDFIVTGHCLEFYGLCTDCQEGSNIS